jgi:hypothetical protein
MRLRELVNQYLNNPAYKEITEMIVKILPPLDKPFETERDFLAYQKKFWPMLIAQHNDALFEFLPKEIRDVPLKDASIRLFEFINAIDSLRKGVLSIEDPLYNILFHNSESNIFLILRCLHSRAKLHNPSRFNQDWDIFAKKHNIIPPSSKQVS